MGNARMDIFRSEIACESDGGSQTLTLERTFDIITSFCFVNYFIQGAPLLCCVTWRYVSRPHVVFYNYPMHSFPVLDIKMMKTEKILENFQTVGMVKNSLDAEGANKCSRYLGRYFVGEWFYESETK